MSEPQQPHFSIEKIYVKDLSLEIPNAPEIFLQRENPEIEIQLNSLGKAVGEGTYEVVLTVTITAKLADKVMFLVEVGQAGIFQIRNVPDADLEPILAVACPNILFPYARETVSDCVIRAGFPPILLAPVNFDVLYQQRLAAAQQQPAPAEVTIQ
jgi:preprotein translocase subunit SecB